MTPLTTIAILLGLCVAAVVAWQLGGPLGGGVLAGFVVGAGISALGIAYQRHVARTSPHAGMQALVIPFLAKLAALGVGVLAFRFLEPVARWADWRSFLVAFAAGAVWVVVSGTVDATRVLRQQRA